MSDAPPGLEISLLGELRVSRAGARVELPPSRKTRALLGYLVLTGRPHRRERLCSMFWDVADDPRGALRWSLSKLRALVDDGALRRLGADRESVWFSAESCDVDVLRLRADLQAADLEQIPLQTLAAWAERFRGELLEGLDLADFDDYQAFCVAEREQTRRLRARILSTLTQRLAAHPEQALVHARSWVRVDPLSQAARIRLLELALASGRREEAQQHYEAGRRLLEELGTPLAAPKADELVQAWRRLNSQPAPAAAEPPPAREVLRPSRPSTPPAEGANVGLVGRQAELHQLVDLLAQVERERMARLMLVRGEPGIGKSRLLSELRRVARQRGATVLRGVSYEGETGRPYGPLIDALRGLSPGEAPAAGLSPLLAELDQLGDDAGGRDRLFAGVSDLVAASARDAPPVLLMLDDVQWLDRASAELLHYVSRINKRKPLLIVLGARAEELPDNAALTRALRSLRRDLRVEELALRPLPREAVAVILQSVGSELSAERVHEQSGGNALFALELARGQCSEETLPSSLAEAVRDRLERVPPEAADVLRWGAVLGCAFSAARLPVLMALPPAAVVEALEALERHALIRHVQDGEEYLFAHEVVRRVVYADLSEPRRVLMHRRVADSLQTLPDVDGSRISQIAHHATLGHDAGLAAAACARAGRRCLRLFANEQAAALARRGLRHADKLSEPERVQRIVELKEVLLLSEAPADVATTVRELEALGEHALELGCPQHARIAFSLLAYLSWECGHWDRARQQVLQAEVVTRGSDDKHRVQALAEAGRCLVMLERDLPEAHAILVEAQVRGRAVDFEPAELPDGLGMIKLHQGSLQEATAFFERAYRSATAQKNRMLEYQTLEHKASLLLERADYSAVAELARAMIDLGEKLRDGSEAPFARALAALSAYALCPDDEDSLSQALQELRMVDAKHRLAVVLNQAALLEVERGESRRAHARASESLPIARLLERPSELLLALALLARTCRDLGDHEGRRAHLAAIDATAWALTASRSARRRAEQLLERPLEQNDRRAR